MRTVRAARAGSTSTVTARRADRRPGNPTADGKRTLANSSGYPVTLRALELSMSDRFWVVRPSQSSRLSLAVCARETAGGRDGVELKGLDIEGCTIGFHGLLLEIGQPVALGFASGAILNGFVREA